MRYEELYFEVDCNESIVVSRTNFTSVCFSWKSIKDLRERLKWVLIEMKFCRNWMDSLIITTQTSNYLGTPPGPGTVPGWFEFCLYDEAVHPVYPGVGAWWGPGLVRVWCVTTKTSQRFWFSHGIKKYSLRNIYTRERALTFRIRSQTTQIISIWTHTIYVRLSSFIELCKKKIRERKKTFSCLMEKPGTFHEETSFLI